MPRILYTVDNLVQEVRSQLDEANEDSVDTQLDILPSLNRAQDYAFDTLARKYPEPILQHSVFNIQGGVQEYTIPEDIFEDRLLKMEIEIPSGSGGSTFREVQRISYRDISLYESSSSTNIPQYYCVIQRKVRFVSTPTGTYNARIWSLRNPEKLMLPQGRITVLNTASNYVIVDSAGDSLTTEADQLGSYVNVVDGQTGEIKGSLQIQLTDDANKITFRTSPLRDIVLGRTISGDMTDMGIELDDYLSPIDGICVPYYGRPTSNFLIQFAVSEITRKLGGNADAEEKILEKFEKQVERTWVGREISLRVKKKSKSWGMPVRRLYWE